MRTPGATFNSTSIPPKRSASALYNPQVIAVSTNPPTAAVTGTPINPRIRRIGEYAAIPVEANSEASKRAAPNGTLTTTASMPSRMATNRAVCITLNDLIRCFGACIPVW